MSIGIVLIGKDGIILASDSRRTFLDGRYEDNAPKVFALTPRVGIIALGGHAGYQYWMVERFILKKTYQFGEKVEAFEDVVDSFVHSVKDDYDYITSRSNKQVLLDPHYQLLFILSGYNSKDKACIVNLVSDEPAYPFAPDYCNRGTCVGGIDLIWHYWARRLEEENLKIENMSIKSLKVLAAFVINETAKASNLVNGIPQIFVIRQGENIEKVGVEEVGELKRQVESVVDIEKVVALL
jgi:20S proteasome alpha/beta subunit